MEFTPTQTATVLAALRFWQDALSKVAAGRHLGPFAPTFVNVHSELFAGESVEPMLPGEIDELCQAINVEAGNNGQAAEQIAELLVDLEGIALNGAVDRDFPIDLYNDVRELVGLARLKGGA